MFKLITFTSLILFIFSGVAQAETSLVVKHYQKQARYEYGAQLLDLALSKLGEPYDIQAPETQNMNEGRGELEVVAGRLDVQWMSTSNERESKLIPIRIPIYRGILGMRLLLIEQTRKQEFSGLRAIEDLRNFTAVHGRHWGDLPVYAANGLSVETLVNYEKLFALLKLGRVDYFHRGLNEIWAEQERHQDSLAIADKVMLYYPLPVYYFVTKLRPDLARKIKTGLTKAIEDGSFRAHFLAFHQEFIDKGQLDTRHLIVLRNPGLPENTPYIDTSWWLNESFAERLNR